MPGAPWRKAPPTMVAYLNSESPFQLFTAPFRSAKCPLASSQLNLLAPELSATDDDEHELLAVATFSTPQS